MTPSGGRLESWAYFEEQDYGVGQEGRGEWRGRGAVRGRTGTVFLGLEFVTEDPPPHSHEVPLVLLLLSRFSRVRLCATP